MTPMSSNPHVVKLLSCYTAPPDQQAVGSSPEQFISELGNSFASQLNRLPHHGKKNLNRAEVRTICHDKEIDDLVAYCVVMRWGGRNAKNFRLTISDESRDKLKSMLNQLRGSKQPRRNDFEQVQKACREIKGLGISFYTKLLFFFRSQEDAYILDQWTAKSINLLFDPAPIKLASTHFPSPETTPAEYEDFCAKLEALQSYFDPKWNTGEEVERALFSAPGKDWRVHVKMQFPTAPAKKRKPTPPTTPSKQSRKVELAELIAKTHEEKSKEIDLPAEKPTVINTEQNQPRVNCGTSKALNWQYNVNEGSIRVQATLYNQNRDLYEDLRNAFGLAPGEHDFGDGITGNGKRVVEIKITEGAATDKSEWDRIAKEVVSEMHRLYERITDVLP